MRNYRNMFTRMSQSKVQRQAMMYTQQGRRVVERQKKGHEEWLDGDDGNN